VNNFTSSANSLYFYIKNRVSRNWFILFYLFAVWINLLGLFSACFMVLVLIILGFESKRILGDLIQNSVTYFLRAGLIVVLIYYLAPKYLFNKKTLLFFCFRYFLLLRAFSFFNNDTFYITIGCASSSLLVKDEMNLVRFCKFTLLTVPMCLQFF
jgi:hypothetical protein